MKIAAFALLGLLAFQTTLAAPPPPAPAQPIEQGDYVNSDGARVHRPAHTRSGKPPAGASAQCRDGTFSFSKHRRGTCSGHGGVSAWL